jgi:phosphatidylinositol-3,4,5-trisphosphate 3-phosphatase/dual-specificity protein phosphatase PTEN
VLHCISGRGRTGTAICCYLLYSGRFTTADEALFYYDKQKYLKGGGITLPS